MDGRPTRVRSDFCQPIQLLCTCVPKAPLNHGMLVDGGSTGLSIQLFALLRPWVSLPSAHSLPVSPKQSADYPMVGFFVTNHCFSERELTTARQKQAGSYPLLASNCQTDKSKKGYVVRFAASRQLGGIRLV